MFVVDKYATDGYRAALAGSPALPPADLEDDLLIAAWRLGHRLGREARSVGADRPQGPEVGQ